MINRYLGSLSLLLLGITVWSVSAQDLNYRSDAINRDNGLSNSSVSCINKDKAGFIWFGTWNGLNRYDGYELTVFQFDPQDSTTLSNSRINALYQDNDGLMWIGTDDGLNRYDLETGKFHRYYAQKRNANRNSNFQINSIIQDKYGLLWIGSQDNGLYSFNKQTGQFTHFFNTFSDKSNNIYCILADNLNTDILWLGTAEGLFLYEKASRSFNKVNAGNENASLSVQSMVQDGSGNLYIGTWGNGLLKYERGSKRLKLCGAKASAYRSCIVRNIVPYGRDNLIMSTTDFGLLLCNLKSGEITDWKYREINKELNDKVVMSLYADPTGIFWIGTYYDGIIKLVPLINRFNHYGSNGFMPSVRERGGVTAIMEDSRGFLWLGTRFGGLYQVDRKTNRYKVYNRESTGINGLSSSNILSLIEHDEGGRQVIWIGTDGGGLNRFEPATGEFTVFIRRNGSPEGPSSNSISSLLSYDNDHLLIGTRGRNLGEGLDVFNLKTRKFVNLRNNPSNPSSLSNNNILFLFRDKSGTVWVGTRNGGLNKLVIKNIDAQEAGDIGYFVRYISDPANPHSIGNNTVYAIQEDVKNNLWIGTSGGGLSKFDRNSGTFTSFPRNKYFTNNIIYGIQSDGNNNLWLSTSRGVIAFNLLSGEMHSFDRSDGLQENGFIYGSTFKAPSGELFFGGIRGCNSFHPDSIRINLRVPKTVITSLNFSGTHGNQHISYLNAGSTAITKRVKLPYYLNDFSLSFSALDYEMPAKNRYRYRLDGYDKDWTETDASRRYVNYTNLSPGKYIFTVIGSNSYDIWNHEGTSIEITIMPPFWGTTYFRVMIILIIAGIVVFLFLYIIRKYRKEKFKAEQEALESVQDERWQLRTLIDSIPDSIFIKDKESRFLVANKKVASLMGTTPENLIGKTDFEFYTADLAQGFFNDEQEIIRTGNPMINYEEPALDEQGNRIILSTTKVPYRNKTGEIIGIVGICRDITRLKRIEIQLRKKSEDLQETNSILEERQEEILYQSEELAEQAQNLRIINTELERLNRTKDKFFSIIAHDLRNPFNAIIGFSELLRNDYYEMDNQQKLNLLELINVSSETAYNLLENLLQWARTQTDKIKYSPENFDLHEVVNLVINLHGIIAQKKCVTLKNEIALHTMVHADKNMINTVLRNLISNAIKFSKPDGVILVTASLTQDCVEVNIIDKGVGMSRESLGKLFRIDTYYSTSGTMGESGTGLGLIICKEFVEKNNGRIKATSLEGAGTTLSFTLGPAKLN
jgi:PAS domain S-box-containing protein